MCNTARFTAPPALSPGDLHRRPAQCRVSPHPTRNSGVETDFHISPEYRLLAGLVGREADIETDTETGSRNKDIVDEVV